MKAELTKEDWERLLVIWGNLTNEYAGKELDKDDELSFWGTANMNRGIAFKKTFGTYRIGI